MNELSVIKKRKNRKTTMLENSFYHYIVQQFYFK